jgi:hypothetical protein
MQHGEFAQLIDNYRTSGTVITTGTPVKIVLHNGDIVDVEKVEWSGIDGGQIQIFAGPTEDDEPDDIVDDDLGDEVDDERGMSEYK